MAKLKLEKEKPLSAQGKLLEDIFESRGGTSEVSRLLNVSRQLVSYWKRIGQIPLSRIEFVAKKLGVSTAALNFKKAKILSDGAVSWDKVYADTQKAIKRATR